MEVESMASNEELMGVDTQETIKIEVDLDAKVAIEKAKEIASLAGNTVAWVGNTAARVASTAAEWAQIAATTAWRAICVAATAVTTAFGAAIRYNRKMAVVRGGY